MNDPLSMRGMGIRVQRALILFFAALMSCTLAACVMSDAALQRGGLAQLAAKEEIRDLMIRYGRLMDEGKLEEVSWLFATQGRWSGAIGNATTPAMIHRLFEERVAPFVRTMSKPTFHVVDNIFVEMGRGGATASSRWLFYGPDRHGEPKLLAAGRYADEFMLEDGHWRFASRTILTDFSGLTSGNR